MLSHTTPTPAPGDQRGAASAGLDRSNDLGTLGVQGAYLTFNAGVRPVGALIGGALGGWLGLRRTLWIAVIGGSASILPLLPSPLPRIRELPARIH